MSSDILEFIEDDKSNVIGLTMLASGHAYINIMVDYDSATKTDSVKFFLTPNKEGIENAEKISSALLSWVEHIKTTNEISV